VSRSRATRTIVDVLNGVTFKEEETLLEACGNNVGIAMVVLALEDEFNLILEDEEVDALVTMKDLLDLVDRKNAVVAG
jgi:hypothetical protein